ncbi:MAG TPA: AraC family transcriptional regulator [Saprospiraceae bacterium]|nr:AraC family transcriptional regulator [Saprospiraceae bacterium]
MKKLTYSTKELVIRDHATVSSYLCEASSRLDFQADALDIFMFCSKKGQLGLHVSFIPHPLELGGSEAIFLAYPRGEWNVKVQAEESSEFFIMKMEVSSLHKLINPEFDSHQLDSNQRVNMKDLMRLIPVNPSLLICFEQLMHHKLRPPFQHMFEKAKFLEIFSLLMESSFGQPMDVCPVALSPAIESKLQQVRRHIIEHLDEAPDPDKLAVLYELPRNTLREGYRYIYGKTIHQYHTDHKLESAMQMLNQGELLVKEVAFKIGYQNPSHFISAFKKKFGYTPKQYLKREVITLS